MKVLVTGAGGMLGTDVVKAARERRHEVVAVDHGALDVTDEAAVRRAIERERPDVVLHCAAYTRVDDAEEDSDGAHAVNADGARHVAEAADGVAAAVVYPSTDYVFDGLKGEPYLESDEPRPLSVYGQSKLTGERDVAAANPRHLIVRSSWLFGRGGPNFVDTMLSLARDRDEVRVVRDQVGSPTHTRDLATAILELLDREATGVHHVAAAGECSWHELAGAAFEATGASCRAVPCTSDEFPRPAPRPAYSVLRSELDDTPELPHWREGLASYLAEAPAA